MVIQNIFFLCLQIGEHIRGRKFLISFKNDKKNLKIEKKKLIIEK